MRRFVPGMLVVLLVAMAAGPTCVAAMAAAVSGTVRDVHGTPQMGTLVELLSADATVIASAFSDSRGCYIMPAVKAGSYQLRASAAFFVPVLRNNLRLQAGTQAVVNLTMSAMFEAENWLPTQRRRADEPADDWKWTLRSTASRPLLRLVDQDGEGISSSADRVRKSVSEGRVQVTNGDGTFGDGGMHQTLFLDRTMEDGDGAVLRADVGSSSSFSSWTEPPAPSVTISTGYERRLPFGGSTRLVSSFQSHPELTNGTSTNGFQVLQMATAHRIVLGDMVMIDAGTLVQAERLEATRINAEPFVRLTARPGSDVMVEYRYATGRDLQSADDLDRLKPILTAITNAQGRPLSTRGSHQEASLSVRLGSGQVLSTAVYLDHFQHTAIAGSGELSHAALQQSVVVADPTTGTFALPTAGYGGRGLSASAMQPLTAALSVWAEFDLGTALREAALGANLLSDPGANLVPRLTPAGSLALRGKILHTGTSLKAQYRWQPLSTLTPVNAYNFASSEAYLGLFLRQRVWAGRFLPRGVDAVVEATNLLEQGYRPILAPDGQTLFLAQVPRGIQGGLAFNF